MRFIVKFIVNLFRIASCFFSDINISQGSVAMHLRYGGIYSYQFTANLLQSLPMKEFWKSIKIW